MSSVHEIETTLRQLPPHQRWEMARWLLENLQRSALRQTEAHNSGENGTPAAPLPDYTARRQRIFGDKVLPNMVLVASGQEPW